MRVRSTRTGSTDAGATNTISTSTEGQCDVVSTTAVGWSEQTALGTPRDLFSSFVGSCQAPFRWDGAAWSTTVAVGPLQGQSTIAVTVVVDPTSARWVTFTLARPVAPEMPLELTEEPCGSQLQVDGRVTLELPEGSVALERPFTLGASGAKAPGHLTIVLHERDFGPWVSFRKLDPAVEFSMSIDVTAPAQACSGQILLGYRRGQAGGNSAVGRFATWSSTGCPAGAEVVDIRKPWHGLVLATELAEVFDQVTIPGKWNDGATTNLALAISLPVTEVCSELVHSDAFLTIPVDVVASTADARVRGLAASGSIRTEVDPHQNLLWRMELLASTDLACASEADTLPYRGANCATDRQVSAQLSLDCNPSLSYDGGVLDFLIYQRQRSVTGAADRADSLQLGHWL